jgi:short-subunit dehydrogenase
MTEQIKHQVVCITGTSSGIGAALAKEFHQQGYRVMATARNLEAIAPLSSLGIITYALDVNDPEQIDQVIQKILVTVGKIDILVNNAGYGLMGALMDLPAAEIRQQLETNAIAPVVLTQKIAPIMKAQGKGLIINIGSISGIVTTPFAGAYCASKAALNLFSDTLRMELKPFGIHVLTVQAGAVQSDIGNKAEQLATQLFPAKSWYATIKASILRRSQASQVDAMPTEMFAKKLIAAATRKKPPAILRLGKKSFSLPLLYALLPTLIFEKILAKKFSLDQDLD